jgi:hypothetical protein
VRLAGAPPKSIGKFDLIINTRHTGDFLLFRIYADKTTVQQIIQKTMSLYPKKHFFPFRLTVLLKMISRLFWLSRKTNEYLPAVAVAQIAETNWQKIEQH